MSVSTASHIRPLNILHTSDWHLGRRLYGHMRYAEFEAFLSWLHDTISTQQVDVLIIAGDIFDTMTPSNRAQSLYYDFLTRIVKTHCQHVVIVAGNHDSPTFLDAAKGLLQALNVQVVGTACEDPNDEVLLLSSDDTENSLPLCLIAAVPYLRDRDVRSSQAGESGRTKDANVIAGIEAHYRAVTDCALAEQASLLTTYGQHVPIVATGHLFAAGGRTTEDDGVRDLYVGSLGSISANLFDSAIDYVALGHLHVPQKVGGYEHIRYCGSPIAMGFGEARQQKQVLLIQFGDTIRNRGIKSHDSDDIKNISTEKFITSKVSTPLSKLPKTSKAAVRSEYTTPDLFADLEENTDIVNDEQTGTTNSTTNIINTPNVIKDTPQENQTPKMDAGQMFYDPDKVMQVHTLPVPCFQKLAQISGDWSRISAELTALVQLSQSIWLEVIYNGAEIITDLRERINDLVADSDIVVLKISNKQIKDRVMMQAHSQEALQDLSCDEVFERCLSAHEIVDTQKPALRDAYQHILHMIEQNDANAE
ncbi:exonuclease SbcCD subunit D C-terminal domain-containing protein [Psychrobacter sp. LV10R520-6]|uniref:exonuclease SbcCD subunit D C-terminal domain-containing protein n=1 Tax=Psychrobacter sp. LV10R520-6 TaxID=1415574 RepID=UPI0024C98B75|nr:exonuclease SbcCD subunit D C-terminal domain-containing protein [Psychrobacter sp. LV10R520-6]SNT69784.1 Exodeoxyribonuclease I subunit D [Psychrobacter sp. LV10R520-6]